jgi:hypothetical protein
VAEEDERCIWELVRTHAAWLAEAGPGRKTRLPPAPTLDDQNHPEVLNVFDSPAVFRSNSGILKQTMNKPSTITSLICTTAVAVATLALAGSARAEEHKHGGKADLSKLPPAATKANVTYTGDIKAIFDASCVKCHGAEKPKAGLKLNTLEGALKGTKDGKVIEPGHSTKSSLVISVACISDDEDSWMPPKNNKAKIAPLTKEQVGLIRAWVDQGAK